MKQNSNAINNFNMENIIILDGKKINCAEGVTKEQLIRNRRMARRFHKNHPIRQFLNKSGLQWNGIFQSKHK